MMARMRPTTHRFLAAAGVVMVTALAWRLSAQQAGIPKLLAVDSALAGRYIVVFRDGATPFETEQIRLSAMNALRPAVQASAQSNVEAVFTTVLSGAVVTGVTNETLANIAALPSVAYIVPDARVQ